jgi:hypothetical protein
MQELKTEHHADEVCNIKSIYVSLSKLSSIWHVRTFISFIVGYTCPMIHMVQSLCPGIVHSQLLPSFSIRSIPWVAHN